MLDSFNIQNQFSYLQCDNTIVYYQHSRESIKETHEALARNEDIKDEEMVGEKLSEVIYCPL